MVSELAAGRTVLPFPAGSQSVDRSHSLRAPHGLPDVSGGDNLCDWSNPAHGAGSQVWPVSVMARFLAPQFGIPLADTLAQRLIDRFGSLARAVEAPQAAVEQLCGQGSGVAEAISQARELMLAASAEQVSRLPVKVDDPQLHAYLRMRMLRLPYEELFVVFLDNFDRFIQAAAFCSHQSNEVTAGIDKIYRRAIDLASFRLLLAHNHPSGDYRPSACDYGSNERLKQVGEALGVTLVDHLIVAGSSIFSMRKGRLI